MIFLGRGEKVLQKQDVVPICPKHKCFFLHCLLKRLSKKINLIYILTEQHSKDSSQQKQKADPPLFRFRLWF